MNCPKCGGENPDGARFCNSCANPLTQTQPAGVKVNVKISVIAMVSFSSVIACVVVMALALGFKSGVITLVSIGLLGLAFICGVVSLVQIELSRGKTTGTAFAVIGVMIPVLFLLLFFGRVAMFRSRMIAYRMTCGTNLSSIGRAMLIYANDYEDTLPQAVGPGIRWTGRTPAWDATDRFTAFGLSKDGTGGTATISSSLYSLVKYSEVSPKRFICDKERGVKEFKLSDYQNRNANCKDLIDAWDFGPDPARHCSYCYHNPYGKYYLTTSNKPNMAVAADRNPWMGAPGYKAKDFARFVPDMPPHDGKLEQARYGNTWSHQGDGQNVLFLDNRVNFEKRPYCGIDDDNIYTYWDGDDKVLGTPPVVGSEPADKLDSLLVNDPPITRLR